MGATGRRDSRSIHLPPPFPAGRVKQYRFPSPLDCFPADEMYIPLWQLLGSTPRSPPCWKMLSQLPAKMAATKLRERRTTPLLLRFSTARIFQRPDQQIKCFGFCVSFPFTTTARQNTQITLICSYFLEKTARDAFRLVPRGQASPMKGEIKHFLGEKNDVIPDEGDTPTTRA